MTMEGVKKKYLIRILCIAIPVLFLVAFFWRIRGSVILTPSETIPVSETIFYSQNDSRWKEDRLGDSDFTMGKSGCLVTCMAAAIQMENLAMNGLTPGDLNQYFAKRGVYDAQGNLQWTVLRALGGLQIELPQQVHSNEVTEHLRRKIYPIVRVRMKGLGNFHYVLIVGAENGTFLCVDPLNEQGEVVPLSEFGNRVYAVRYIS